jgi:5-methylcytosine-specific restriction endonuclease McrA
MPKKQITTKQRNQVQFRAKRCCEYCRSQELFATESFSIDHVIPRVKGGRTELNNLAYACLGCNGFKYIHTHGTDPATGETVPLFHPRQDEWADYFAWRENLTKIIGTTAIGRATVVTLRLNRESVVNLRKLLLLIDKHPPS